MVGVVWELASLGVSEFGRLRWFGGLEGLVVWKVWKVWWFGSWGCWGPCILYAVLFLKEYSLELIRSMSGRNSEFNLFSVR